MELLSNILKLIKVIEIFMFFGPIAFISFSIVIINNKTISYILLFQRRQRVLGLLGFYHFEKGELDKAASYFEQSTIDIREVSYFPLYNPFIVIIIFEVVLILVY